MSIVFFGILVGNLCSGALSDWKGRRLPIIISFIGIAIFSILSACAVGYWSLALTRLFVGMSFGIGQPSFQTLSSETSPVDWRIFLTGCGGALFAFGEMYSALLIAIDDPYIQEIRWRWLFCMGAIPSIVYLVLALAFLQESPFYLALTGNEKDAQKVLFNMSVDNGAPLTKVDYTPPRTVVRSGILDAVSHQLQIIWGKSLLLTTLVVLFSCFVLNFVFYGSLYAFPQLMGDMQMWGTPAAQLVIGAMWELVGVAIAFAIFSIISDRKPVMKLYLILMALFMATFAFGLIAGKKAAYGPYPSDGVLEGAKAWLMPIGYYGIKCTNSLGFLVVYQYATEVFPTEARATGVSVGIAGGRIAGMVAPIAYESIVAATGDAVLFFCILVTLTAINFVMVGLLPYETAGMKLQDSTPVEKSAGSHAQSSGLSYRACA